MQKITTFLSYDNQAEEAATLYTSLFNDGKIVNVARYGEGAPMPAGTVMTVEFELDGRTYVALNGGPSFGMGGSAVGYGVSLAVNCETQGEIDELWAKLTADGGKPIACGWLTDKFGLPWQIVPAVLPKLLTSPDKAASGRAMAAMMTMQKLDIAALKRAYENG